MHGHVPMVVRVLLAAGVILASLSLARAQAPAEIAIGYLHRLPATMVTRLAVLGGLDTGSAAERELLATWASRVAEEHGLHAATSLDGGSYIVKLWRCALEQEPHDSVACLPAQELVDVSQS